MPTYEFAKFSQKLHETERIWTPGGVPNAPLRSATEYLWLTYYSVVYKYNELLLYFLFRRKTVTCAILKQERREFVWMTTNVTSHW